MKQRYVIYGTGKVAKQYIEKVAQQNHAPYIIGVLDRWRLDGKFAHLPVMTLEELIEHDVQGIIIATGVDFVKEIYFRLLPFALAHGLKLYSMAQQDLMHVFGGQRPAIRPNLSEQQVKAAILKADVVSFDIFDTLLMRKVCSPVDVFKMVAQKAVEKGMELPHFYRVRREAELAVLGAPLAVIYQKIQQAFHLSTEETAELMALEIACETEVLVSRPYSKALFDFSIKNKKSVVIVSDMYLPSSVLKTLLRQNGYERVPKIYVSCEHGCTKTEGLFAKVQADYPQQTLVHIGDDYEADYLASQKIGLAAIYLPKAYDLAMQTPLAKVMVQAKTLNDSRFVGELCYRLFHHPYTTDLVLHHVTDFAYCFFIPILTHYFDLLAKLLQAKDYAAVLFVARDGYLFQQCYEKLLAEGLLAGPMSKYIASSRKLAIRLGMQNKADIQHVLTKYHLSPASRESCELFSVQEEVTSEQFYEQVLVQAEQLRQNYQKYAQLLDLSSNQPYLYCELNGHGTGEYYFKKAIFHDLDSLYFIRSYLDSSIDQFTQAAACFPLAEECYFPYRYQTMILENILTAPQPTVLAIDRHGRIVYDQERRTDEQIRFMTQIQAEIMTQFLNNYRQSPKGRLSQDLLLPLLELMDEVRYEQELLPIRSWQLYDDLFNRTLSQVK